MTLKNWIQKVKIIYFINVSKKKHSDLRSEVANKLSCTRYVRQLATPIFDWSFDKYK